MAHYDARLAVAGRDDGVRKVVRLTWRTGIIGAALSALFGLTLGHAQHASPPHQQSGMSSLASRRSRRVAAGS